MKVLALCARCGLQYDVTGHAVGAMLRCRCGGPVKVPEPRAAVARVARCASCGAPRTAQGGYCSFCGSKFVDPALNERAVICPGCFIGLPAGSAYCVECGLKLEPQPLPQDAPEYACPRCRVTLLLHEFATPGPPLLLYDCKDCGGMWVPERTFDAIVITRESLGAARTLVGLAASAPPEAREAELVKYIPCPACKNLMNRRNFAQVSGVIVDSCKGHGVWLDAQELNRIIRFIEKGGLEKARASEHERQLAEARSAKAAAPMAVAANAQLFEHRRPASDDLLETVVRGVLSVLFK
ncbi:MAG: zf-TFIIB domain-containing protein [Planctomycetes bacterium]|nr:zf-TFIIB domain-containing protein [Planctomycetota bacterium]